jgi:hypothetical protein
MINWKSVELYIIGAILVMAAGAVGELSNYLRIHQVVSPLVTTMLLGGIGGLLAYLKKPPTI